MTKSIYVCPICNVNLSLGDTLSGGVAIWCTYGKCPSHAANKGAEGKDEEHAYYLAQKLVEQEITQNDKHGPLCGCAECLDLSVEEWAERS